MDLARNNALSIQKHLCLQEPIQAAIHREIRKLPLDDSREPHQRAHIIKPDRPEALLPIQNLKTSLGEPVFSDLQILIRKGQISLTAEKLNQLPVVFSTR